MSKSPRKFGKPRRDFLRTLVYGIGVIGVSIAGFVPVLFGRTRKVRPPGALVDQQFMAACIKCGQCVQVCPVKAIKLADADQGFGIGTPYIDTREQACDFSCDGLQCVLACPTGALTHEINFAHQSEMAWARIDRPESCLAAKGLGFKGLARGKHFDGHLRFDEIDRWNPIAVRDHPYDLELCDLCVRQCPIEIRANQCDAGKPPSGDVNQCPPKPAISLKPIDDQGGFLPEIHEGCVGCGVCEMICPAEPGVIVMDYRQPENFA